MKKKPDNPENSYEVLYQYEDRGVIVTVYSVPPECKRFDLQHTRPKGVPMLTPGCSWVVVPGGM